MEEIWVSQGYDHVELITNSGSSVEVFSSLGDFGTDYDFETSDSEEAKSKISQSKGINFVWKSWWSFEI